MKIVIEMYFDNQDAPKQIDYLYVTLQPIYTFLLDKPLKCLKIYAHWGGSRHKVYTTPVTRLIGGYWRGCRGLNNFW